MSKIPVEGGGPHRTRLAARCRGAAPRSSSGWFRRPGVVAATLCALLGALSSAPVRAEPASPPNIVLIVADDMGWKDIGYNGSEIETPHLDALGATGATLERFYAMPSCSPTRATLLTGQLALRLGVLGPMSKNNPRGLPLDLKTLPQRLLEAGYQTALAGKWHLGYLRRAHHPNQRGFESYYGHVTGGVGYWDHVHGGGYDWQRDGRTVREDGYTTHLIAREAERVIASRDPSKPLFLYVAFNAPHLPNEAPAAALGRYTHLQDERRRAHAAMVSEMDGAIGRIVSALEREGLRDDTLVWFLSDNGGLNEPTTPDAFRTINRFTRRWLSDPPPTRILRFLRMNVEEGGGDNGPFRMGKQSVYEGGVRVPSFVVWPGQIAPARIAPRITVADVLPTLLEVAGTSAPEGAMHDGASRWAAINGAPPGPAPDYVTVGFDGLAYYSGAWKLVEHASRGRELYDLQRDAFEAKDVASAHPDVVEQLAERLGSFPRGEDIALPLWRVLVDPDEFGGEERAAPMAERTTD